MDYKEFKTEFNLAYNNISSNQAPGLDDVEISMYLSKAQVTLEDALYAEFEKSEEARRKLAKVVVTAKLSEVEISDDSKLYCSDDSKVYINTYQVPTDLRYIVNEQVKMKDDADECIKRKFIEVQPVLLDELDTIIKNPFKFNIRRALRLDASYHNQAYIEIITKQQATDKNYIDYYKIRYVKNPEPIFIYSSTDYPNDTIDGQTAPTTLRDGVDLGSLPKETHRQIVEIAAKMAYADYKQ